MTDNSTPTVEGMRRWPHTAGCHLELSTDDTQPDRSLPCTCSESCAPRCAGECGCKACSMAFIEFCDEAGWYGPDGLRDETAALASYRDVTPSA